MRDLDYLKLLAKQFPPLLQVQKSSTCVRSVHCRRERSISSPIFMEKVMPLFT